MARKRQAPIEDFEMVDMLDDDFDVDNFIDDMESQGKRRKARRRSFNARRHLEDRQDQRRLRQHLSDWDSEEYWQDD